MSNSLLPLGIDVSNHQGVINWDAVANAGVKFAFIKCSESTDFTDPWFERNWHEAKRVGLYRGAYHYLRPERNPDPRVEMGYMYHVLEDKLEPGDMIALDQEPPNTNRTPYGDWTLYALQIAESYFGFKPLLYTSPYYITKNKLASNPDIKEYGLWLASWQENFPGTPSPWEFIAFWQYSSTARIHGVSGDCDVNRFNGSLDRIPAYGMTQKTPVPPRLNIAEIRERLNAIEAKHQEAKNMLDDTTQDLDFIREKLEPFS